MKLSSDTYFVVCCAQVSQPPLELLGDGGPSLRSDRFFHLGMGQASPDGSALLFMHR